MSEMEIGGDTKVEVLKRDEHVVLKELQEAAFAVRTQQLTDGFVSPESKETKQRLISELLGLNSSLEDFDKLSAAVTEGEAKAEYSYSRNR